MNLWLIALLIWILPALVLAPMLLWTGLSGRRRSDQVRSAAATQRRERH